MTIFSRHGDNETFMNRLNENMNEFGFIKLLGFKENKFPGIKILMTNTNKHTFRFPTEIENEILVPRASYLYFQGTPKVSVGF